MKRREVVAVLGACAAWPLAARAQQTALPVLRRVGFLAGGWPEFKHYGAFSKGMSELGYVEGRDFVIEWRYVEGKFERVPILAAELVKLNVDVIVVNFTGAAKAAQQATSTIPIVMAYSTDPVGAGLVNSLARPGGNITGMATMLTDITPKQIELLSFAVSGLARIAVLTNPGNLAHSAILKSVVDRAASAHVIAHALEVRTREDIDLAFSTAAKMHDQGLIVVTDPLFTRYRQRIAQLAIETGMPSIFPTREYVDVGGLFSYGDSITDFHRRAAFYVDKIFKGAKPADLPVQQPTNFEFVINLKTAKALAMTIPPMLLGRADEVIE